MTTQEFTDIKNDVKNDPTIVERWYDPVKQIDIKITKKDWFYREVITERGEVMERRYHNDINQTIPYKDNWDYLNLIGYGNPLLSKTTLRMDNMTSNRIDSINDDLIDPIANQFPHIHIFYDRIGINNGTNLSENVGIGRSTPSVKVEVSKKPGEKYGYTANEMRQLSLSGLGVYTEQYQTKKERQYTDYDYVVMGSFQNKHWIEELWDKLVAVK
jgi:hypothetical protein